MTLVVSTVLGHVDEPQFAGRRVVQVPVAWDEASRRRLRRSAIDGTDLMIGLDRGEYLSEGVVLDDDGERVLVTSRVPEPALVVRLDLALDPARLVEQAAAIGHAFGNQHAPVEVAGGEVRVPLLTSDAIARATVESLKLEGAVIDIKEVALGRLRPLSVLHSHSHGHAS
jgi:urease accessory protein